MTSATVEYLIEKHGPLIGHINLSDLLSRHPNSLRFTLERSSDPWVDIINRARRKIGGRVYYSIEALAPLFSSEVTGAKL